MSMTIVTETGGRLDQLEQLALVLAAALDSCEDVRSIAQIARQYRETIREIEEIKGVGVNDEISEILAE